MNQNLDKKSCLTSNFLRAVQNVCLRAVQKVLLELLLKAILNFEIINIFKEIFAQINGTLRKSIYLLVYHASMLQHNTC